MDGVRTMLALTLVLVTVVVVANAATVASQDADPGVSVLDPMDGTVLPRSKFVNTASGATKGKPRLVFDLPDDVAGKHTAAGTGGATGAGAGAGADTQDTLEPKPVEVGVSPGAFRATAKKPEEAVVGSVATAPNVATVGKQSQSQSQSQSQAQAQAQEDAKKEPATGTGAGAPKQKMFGFADVPRLITAFHFEFVDLMFVWFCFAMLLCVVVVVFLVLKLVKRVKTARQLQVIANPDPDKQD